MAEIWKPAVSFRENHVYQRLLFGSVLKATEGKGRARKLELTKCFRTARGKAMLLAWQGQISEYEGRESERMKKEKQE